METVVIVYSVGTGFTALYFLLEMIFGRVKQDPVFSTAACFLWPVFWLLIMFVCVWNWSERNERL